ncbi:MAG: hypothetical protein MUF54_20005, partial [Polyangiaceae bacterium]|nr:hypothetical protein [Polyangiaceae bacterium]
MPADPGACEAWTGNAFASEHGDGSCTSALPAGSPQAGEQPGTVDPSQGSRLRQPSDPSQLTNLSGTVAGGPCAPAPFCDAPLPYVSPARGFRSLWSTITARGRQARHRGRDLILVSGQPQWVLGKFAYGAIDKDMHREDVEVYILRDCGSNWTKVGTFQTTWDDEHETVEGVQDTGGRLYVNLADV